MKVTEAASPAHFHKVVDCQYACPAHTPVPEYIRLIAAGLYTEAYMVNWQSNVFPGILGRTCDRPCEPAAGVVAAAVAWAVPVAIAAARTQDERGGSQQDACPGVLCHWGSPGCGPYG
ncbi:hypothetical protein J4558_19380 [Leptolyngbya sp. 15MV]|nr:hypothetical protein J4558_19380 [Leptolyngbya sp. 15MV]